MIEFNFETARRMMRSFASPSFLVRFGYTGFLFGMFRYMRPISYYKSATRCILIVEYPQLIRLRYDGSLEVSRLRYRYSYVVLPQ